MFDFLDGLGAENAIPAGHHAIQFIRQWAAASARAGRRVSFEGLPPFQVELAQRVVAEIEAREGGSVVAIPQSKIEEYVTIVAQSLQDLSRREFHADVDRGRHLISELRRMK